MSLTKARAAVKQMRALSDNNIPFSFSFVGYNQTTGESKGVKHIEKAILRRGYSSKHSDKHDSIIAYKDIKNDAYRNCYLPLIIKFNGKWID